MIQFHIFPGGRRHALTFSYDDGHPNDARLINLFDLYGTKGTFHLNARRYEGMTDDELKSIGEIYRGHEIAGHTFHHGFPKMMLPETLTHEIMDERLILEKIAGYPVLGMSYPFGNYSREVIETMQDAGILYSRTTNSTNWFTIPTCFMEWNPTCHHSAAEPLIDSFLDAPRHGSHLFYIWGHSYEFRTEEDWDKMESMLERLSGKDSIWYATNMDIFLYAEAQRKLEISVDEKVIYNPSALDVWVEKNGTEVLEIPAGQTVLL